MRRLPKEIPKKRRKKTMAFFKTKQEKEIEAQMEREEQMQVFSEQIEELKKKREEYAKPSTFRLRKKSLHCCRLTGKVPRVPRRF